MQKGGVMNKYNPIYSKNHIEYWPYRKTAVVASVFFIFFALLAVLSMCLLFLQHAVLENATLIVIYCTILCSSLLGAWGVRKFLRIKVTISSDGITIQQSPQNNTHIFWNQICDVRYQYQSRYGLEKYIITYCTVDKSNTNHALFYDSINLDLRFVCKQKVDVLFQEWYGGQRGGSVVPSESE
jgi:hypothetical protein